MVIFPLAPDQTIAQMWSSGARGGGSTMYECSRINVLMTSFHSFALNTCTGAVMWEIHTR